MFSPQERRIRHQRYSGLIQFAPQPFGLTRTGKLWKPLLFSFFWNWCLSLNRNEKIHLGISQWPEYTFSEVWKKMGNETLAHEPHTRHKRWCQLTHLPSSAQTLPPSHPTWPEALPRFPGVGPAKHLFDARHSSGPQCWCSSKSKKAWNTFVVFDYCWTLKLESNHLYIAAQMLGVVDENVSLRWAPYRSLGRFVLNNSMLETVSFRSHKSCCKKMDKFSLKWHDSHNSESYQFSSCSCWNEHTSPITQRNLNDLGSQLCWRQVFGPQ